MRIDKFLKVSRLIKRRTVAKSILEQGRVSINDKKAKPSATVNIGDELALRFGQKLVVVRVERITEHAAKGEAIQLYSIIKECQMEQEEQHKTQF